MTTQILDRRPAALPAAAQETATADLLQLFGLDQSARYPARVVCHWHNTAEGRLAAIWKPEIVSVLPR